MNYFKQERDYHRIYTTKLTAEAGLLVKPQLLKHMEKAIKEVDSEKDKLEKLKQENERLKKTIEAIKSRIAEEGQHDEVVTPVKIARKTKEDGAGKVYKGRPTLVVPVLPDFTGIHF